MLRAAIPVKSRWLRRKDRNEPRGVEKSSRRHASEGHAPMSPGIRGARVDAGGNRQLALPPRFDSEPPTISVASPSRQIAVGGKICLSSLGAATKLPT